MRKMPPLIVLLLHLSAVYSDSHSLRYYYTAVSAPRSGIPEYFSVGYLDDQEIMNYNSDSGMYLPSVELMKKREARFWRYMTPRAKGNEAVFLYSLDILMECFNHTKGFHSIEAMHSCELRDDSRITISQQYRYDGAGYLALDTRNGTYTATNRLALITAEIWNSLSLKMGEMQRNFLATKCIDWLMEYVEDGREDLERRVQPQVKVSSQDNDDIMTLHCLVYGFHPRAVDVMWMKNGVNKIPTYQTTGVLPNPDGTYQKRVSVEVSLQKGDNYSCYVEHSSLEKPLNVTWEPEPEPEKPRSWVTPEVVTVVAVAVLVAGIVGFLVHRKMKSRYNPASTSDTSADCNLMITTRTSSLPESNNSHVEYKRKLPDTIIV